MTSKDKDKLKGIEDKDKLKRIGIGLSVAILIVAILTYVATTQPSSIIVEEASTNGKLTHDGQYFLNGADIRNDTIKVYIWNAGARVAKDVEVDFRYKPYDRPDLYNSNIQIRKCRQDICFNEEKPPVNIKAIEPNGFYIVKAEIALNATAIKEFNEKGGDLYLTIDVKNPRSFPYGDEETYRQLKVAVP